MDFGRDVEQQLGIYVECRGAFANLDPVLDRCVLETAKLAMKCKRLAARGAIGEAFGACTAPVLGFVSMFGALDARRGAERRGRSASQSAHVATASGMHRPSPLRKVRSACCPSECTASSAESSRSG